MVSGSSHSAQAKQESWYWGFDLGWAKPSYGSSISTVVDSLSSSAASRTSLGGSLGFYWPISTGETVIGFASTAIVDSFDFKPITLSFNQTLLGFSAIHTFGQEPGVGFFVRGDAGLATVSVGVSGSSMQLTAQSNTGFGFLGGAGYGIALSDSTRLLFETRYTYMKAEDFNSSAISICVGPLF